MEIVINSCHGGFGLSNKAVKRYYELKGQEVWFYKRIKYKAEDGYDEYIKTSHDDTHWDVYPYSKDFGNETKENIEDYLLWLAGYVKRNDVTLIQVVKELGQEANGMCSKLKIVEIPDDVDWEIAKYDGNEWVDEKHRTWS